MKVIRIALILFLCVCERKCEFDADSQKCETGFLSQHLRRIENLMDPIVQPCSDFHEYTCGNWRIPYASRAMRPYDTLSQMKADNKRMLIDYFEKIAMNVTPQPTLTVAERRVVNFYNSCLDELIGSEKKTSIEAFTQTLRQLSRWPILDADFDERTANASFNWEHISAQLRRYGVQSLWQLRVQSNWQSAEHKIFYISKPDFDLLKPHKMAESYDDDSVYLYQRYVKYLMFDLGMKVRRAITTAEEIVEFEKQLMLLTIKDNAVILREPQTLGSLMRELPGLRLWEYFNTLLQEFALPADQIKQLLVAVDKDYLRKLEQYMRTAKAETIGKYLLVQFLAHFEFHMHEDNTYMEQKQHCLQQLNNFLPNELSDVFFKLHYGKESDQTLLTMHTDLNEIFSRLKVQFEKLLNATKIFEDDAVAKVLGLEKLRAMRLLLPKLESLSNFAHEFEITENYNENLINLSKWHAKQTIGNALQLGASDSDADTYGPLSVNAYYRLKKNAIEIPIGLLRLPVYHHCLSKGSLYGSLGYMIAHELLHGFDYDGLNYDKTGSVANNWSAKSIIQFGIKSKCYLSDRYGSGYTTINENIADSEGLRLALQALLIPLSTEAEHRQMASTTQVETVEQLKLFFISFAQTWCGSNSTPSTITTVTSLHAGHRERVNNVVGNFIEFAETFKCKPESNMNPADKCQIW